MRLFSKISHRSVNLHRVYVFSLLDHADKKIHETILYLENGNIYSSIIQFYADLAPKIK